MENRKPLGLRNVLIVYNLLQTLFSTWIFYEVSADDTFLFLIAVPRYERNASCSVAKVSRF